MQNKESDKKLREQKQIEDELAKQDFAKSFNEYYEYDVVTVLNENHGRVDREEMLNILKTHALHGWRLHSLYSNELGIDAIRVLGFGVNATVCEDVLIFERRVEKLQ